MMPYVCTYISQESLAQCWTIILYFTMIFNLNYGPFGKGTWFNDKQGWAWDFCHNATIHDTHWQRYAGKIAKALKYKY